MRNVICKCGALSGECHAFSCAVFEDTITILGATLGVDEQFRRVNDFVDTHNGAKNPNPKDSIGSSKIPLHLWPETASIMGSLGLLDGAGKYGRGNYRASPVRASIYYDAAKRHLNGWFSGRPCDPDSGLPDLAHALACIAIIVDAQAAGTIVDDRDYNSGYAKFIDEMTPFVKLLQEKHADKSPKHYTIADNA